MSLEIVRRIRGNVHGTIDVTALEDAVISHEYVQRLRRVKQLAFLHYVFPGATHTRFEHSLGVMQLAGFAWDKLKVNQRRMAETASKIPDFAYREKKVDGICHGLLAPTFSMMNQLFDSDYHLQVLRLAALLHDIGHPPFSHSGERFLSSWQEVYEANPKAPVYIRHWLEKRMDALSAKGIDPSRARVRHEVFSLLLIEKILKDTYKEFQKLKFEVDARDVISVIAPEISPGENSPLLSHGTYKTLTELISGELDIDRMDYLLRDSRECGVVYGIFDAGRILDGLCIYQDNEDKGIHVAISQSGLAAFEDYLRARQSMYLQVYFHKTSASAEAMMQYLSRKLGNWTLPSEASAFAEIDEYNIGNVLMQAAEKLSNDIYEHKDFERVCRDLLYRRRLWKRVYETTGRDDDVTARERLTFVKDLVSEQKLECEHVSSLTSLTRFRPRQPAERSRNYLRLIQRDEFDIPRVVPIEDYAAVVEDNMEVRIHRLYVDNRPDNQGNLPSEKIKIAIHRGFKK